MRSRTAVTLLVVALGAAALAATGATAATVAVAVAVAVRGSTPSWATPANRVATSDPNQTVVFRTYLRLRDAAGAAAMARAVSDPASPTYQSYLSADQVRRTFAPATATVAAVSAWLSRSGLKVGYVPPNNQFVEATGTAGQVEQAFGVKLSDYAFKGRRLRAPDRELSVPASLAGAVSGVVGVDQAMALLRPDNAAVDRVAGAPRRPAAAPLAPGVAPPPDGFRNAPPCSAYWAQKTSGATLPPFDGYPQNLPYAPCGYTPTQLRQAYGVDSLVNARIDGRGTTVAVIDAFASPTLLADAQEYARRHDPAHPLRSSQFSQRIFPEVDPSLEGPCDASGWYGEQSLDVEAVHAMAPGANIVYVGGSDCFDSALDLALNEVVSRQLAQIATNSYGDAGEDLPPDVVEAFQSIAVQAAIQGIGLYFSSGDSGDEADDLGGPPSPDFPASSPLVTAVGGTSLGVGATGRTVLETGWETTKSTLTAGGVWDPPPPGAFLYGSGGGTSRLFAEPGYQQGIVPDALAVNNQVDGQRGRVVPDIAMDGDPNTGFLFGSTQTFPEGVHYDESRIGGTSLSSPLFAGVMALSDGLLHVRHGFLNPLLYSTRGAPITDIRHVMAAVARVDFVNGLDGADGLRTSIRTFDDQSLAIHTAPGYDDVTGLGVPHGVQFVARP
ncbi:MAG: S53 family peptidase [Solirubrobacteraceae bacterium]